jgi:hypothetical protein
MRWLEGVFSVFLCDFGFCFTCLIQSRLSRSAQSNDFSFSLFRFVMDWAPGRSAHCFDFYFSSACLFFFFLFYEPVMPLSLTAESLLPPVGDICTGQHACLPQRFLIRLDNCAQNLTPSKARLACYLFYEYEIFISVVVPVKYS